MKQIKLSPSLKGNLKKWVRRHPFNPSLETHKSTGKLAGLHSFSVEYDARIIFRIVDDNNIILDDIGIRDEVY